MKTRAILFALTSLLIFIALLFEACKKEDETNNWPTCEITSPSDGEEYKQGEIIPVSVAATDDGSIAEVRFFVDDANKASADSPPYEYDWDTQGESIGDHALKATSIDNDGASKSDEKTIKITKGVGSFFSATPTRGDAPLTVNFTDESNNNPTSWNWDFGDGGTSNEQSPSYTYNVMGQYDVSLTTTGDSGSDTETKTNYINVKGTFTDTRDNQTYSIVTIGEQTWFAENLNYETPNSWWYDNDPANGDVYGRLYQWADVQSACPSGWHAASDNDWKKLEIYLGMSPDEAEKTEERGTDEGMKIRSTTGWKDGQNGTDDVGFSALPGGSIHSNGQFQYLESYAAWWTLNEETTNGAWMRYIEGDVEKMGRVAYNKGFGYSIRCIKD